MPCWRVINLNISTFTARQHTDLRRLENAIDESLLIYCFLRHVEIKPQHTSGSNRSKRLYDINSADHNGNNTNVFAILLTIKPRQVATLRWGFRFPPPPSSSTPLSRCCSENHCVPPDTWNICSIPTSLVSIPSLWNLTGYRILAFLHSPSHRLGSLATWCSFSPFFYPFGVSSRATTAFQSHVVPIFCTSANHRTKTILALCWAARPSLLSRQNCKLLASCHICSRPPGFQLYISSIYRRIALCFPNCSVFPV